jgi:hypothetical protein
MNEENKQPFAGKKKQTKSSSPNCTYSDCCCKTVSSGFRKDCPVKHKKTKQSKETVLAIWYDKGKRHTMTVRKYEKLIQSEANKSQIAEFIYQRLYSRYLKPFQFDCGKYREQYKNGFAIMANCCLLIETLQSFKEGWGDSRHHEQDAFDLFFKKDTKVKRYTEDAKTPGIANLGVEFYKNIRCGILHQGETKNGWKIRRDSDDVFDFARRVINADLFSKTLKNSLETYHDELVAAEWDSELWDNFRVKMRKIIKNCIKNCIEYGRYRKNKEST